MDFNELTRSVLKLFPEAELSQDSDGQVVVHTNLRLTEDDLVVPFELDNNNRYEFPELDYRTNGSN